MPLGFAAAMGGTLTVIGSTSQPMVNTVLEGQGLELMPIFSIFPVAFPSFLFMIVYMVTAGYKMFPLSLIHICTSAERRARGHIRTGTDQFQLRSTSNHR